MIFWIEKEFKNEYIDSANNDGLRCKYPIGFDEQTKTKVNEFVKFIRRNYYFPIRLNVEFFDKTFFLHQADGHKFYGIFYDGDSSKNIYPKICIASRLTERNLIEDVMFSVAHEITHYYQWYFLEEDKRTARSLEIEANKWSKYVVETYFNNHLSV